MTPPTRGLARFAADLPRADRFVTLGEGDTPLLDLDTLGERLGLRRLWGKLETVNPTGSYKDRVAAMSLSLAIQRGDKGWIATSSGNAGAAMAAYGARARLPGLLCLVADAPVEKVAALLPYPNQLLAVRGVGHGSTPRSGTRLMEDVRAAAERHGLFLAITANAFNPEGMQGIDTIAYELAEQAPDASHIYVPTGGGGLLASIARGAEQRGLASRFVACQPEGCAPIADFLAGRISSPEIARCDSGISALQLPSPPDAQLVINAVKRSDGWGTAASDAAILQAQRTLAETEGVFVEPAGAAGLAALVADLHSGRLDAAAEVVLVLTGAGWKDLGRFASEARALASVDVDNAGTSIDEWARSIT